ncbi:uncharacterized protein LOC132194240 isoform X1 [Neocloeon triangulifer]|uniref:uncharacterized protein LOC132194240 isoform X1 n=1 Tax=Neocloeon triangulifer TaxID=2078957 RepID=UPI00286F26CF|nr:uncharacterized protein LOC132194240 isoform X1 [Neocloeon triangulifer]
MPERDFKTSDSKEYYFNEVPTNSSCTLRFRVKTSNDAHICLSASGVLETTPILEIFLGGWENKMSAIRKDYTLPDKVKVSTPDLLSSKEYHKFWIKWNNKGQVDVGRDGNEEPFMSYLDPNPFPISHYGMRTTWGATGKWKDHEVEYVIHEGQAPPAAGPPVATEPETLQHLPYHWVSARNGEIPQGAVVAGKDHGEQVLYAAKVNYNNSQLIGKVNTVLQGARVGCNGQELHFAEYEVLCGGPPTGTWVSAPGGQIPNNAVAGGKGCNGEVYYVGRSNCNGTITVGMGLSSDRHCHFAYGGREMVSNDFEVLINN